ncbi:MAG: response regulator transcription factor [Phototrophicaceae bacterium]
MVNSEKIRLVIIDDNDWVRFSLRIGLESSGIICVGEANNSIEAIKLCEELHPDAVLLDMYLVRENGWENIPKILDVSPDTKIIAMSAFAGEHMIENALENGAVSFISKGDSLTEMINTIIGHLTH